MPDGVDRSGFRLAELVAALSLASDLGLGQPMEHLVRSCRLGLRLAESVGLSEEERAVVYYVALLGWVGCHAQSHEQAAWFGDEIALKADRYEVDMVGRARASFVLRHVGAGGSPAESIYPSRLHKRLANQEIGASMTLQLGDTAPDFEAHTTQGSIRFHDWIGDSWTVLFSHPKDFTPVCTTELGYMAKIKPEFDRRDVKIVGLSVDSTADHARWTRDIEDTQGHALTYPIIGDADFNVSKLYEMLPAGTTGEPRERTPADNQTVRNVFVIGPDKKIKLLLVYPMTTGRNFDEVLRVIDSLQLTAKHRVATPVNWKQGQDVIIAGSVSDDEARQIYPNGWRSPRPYIRIVPQPGQLAAA